MSYEQPRYVVEEKLGDFEIRRYEPYLVAETEVEADQASAGNEGFRRLAGYIFGGNKGAKKIAMTAPVAQAPAAARIAMTAPVTETRAPGATGRFFIQFMMPSELTLASVPEPLDARIRFREMPARRVAAIRYSGSWSEGRYLKHLHALQAAVSREGLEAAGEPMWARYDPPFKPWFLRRNEILVEVRTREVAS
jgi:hypothetical protein